jgi:methyltransferase
MLVTPILLAVIFIPMIVEAGLAARHERVQRARGGLEPPGDVYAIMRVAYPGVFLAMIAEGAWRGSALAPPGWGLAWLGLFVLAKALKWWAIASLGEAWTFRVIVTPGMRRVATGPYRWVRHPNYVAVALELASVGLMSGARLAGPAGFVLFDLLMIRRISVEERALDVSAR